MDSIKQTVNKVIQDPELFKEARYTLASSLPLDLGTISLGYSNGSPKIYLTKMVGQEGCIDWNIQTFLSTWKDAITKRSFTPELTTLFQTVSNEMLPGLTYDIGTFHWFLRPHAEDLKIGFALFGSRSINPLSNDPNALDNLQHLSANIGELVPASSFVFRRVSHNLEIGDISADIFVMVSSDSSVFIQFCFKFLFHPSKLNSNTIQTMSNSLSEHSFKRSLGTMSDAPDIADNEEKSNHANGVTQGNSGKTQLKTKSNGTESEYSMNQKQLLNKDMLYGMTWWQWLGNNKLSLLSVSVAGLAINVASKTISRDMRIKL